MFCIYEVDKRDVVKRISAKILPDCSTLLFRLDLLGIFESPRSDDITFTGIETSHVIQAKLH